MEPWADRHSGVRRGEISLTSELSGAPEMILASHRSSTLIEDVTVTNKVSQNLHAELWLHHLGRMTLCSDRVQQSQERGWCGVFVKILEWIKMILFSSMVRD